MTRPIIPIVPASDLEGRPAGGVGAGRGVHLSSLPPLSVYVHVPWCLRKCPYCDFNSHELKGDIPEARYLAALEADLEQALPLIWGRQVISIFIGGGTPSLLSARAVDGMLAMLRACLNVLPDAEITLEANPGAVEAGRFRDYAASGVNRISLGIQSFDDASLAALGRVHDGRQAHEAIAVAQRAVERVNLDLMYALPGQTLQACLRDVRSAMAYGTGHLALYHLTMEPNTVFAKYPPVLPDDDASAAMQDMIERETTSGGWRRYEISAYAKPGQQAWHNVNYWEFGDYLGLGPGAHGKLSFPDKITRHAKLKQPGSWMEKAVLRDGSHIAQESVVPAGELAFEFMLNALRLKEGVQRQLFTQRTGLPWPAIGPTMQKLVAKGLMADDPDRIRTTELGWHFLNDVLEAFLGRA